MSLIVGLGGRYEDYARGVTENQQSRTPDAAVIRHPRDCTKMLDRSTLMLRFENASLARFDVQIFRASVC